MVYTKINDIIMKLNLKKIEVYDNATIIFNDGKTRNYKAIYINHNEYIIGEIKKIEYPQEYLDKWLVFKAYDTKIESINVFIKTGHIKGDIVQEINCKELRSIYYLDKKKADSKLYRIVDE